MKNFNIYATNSDLGHFAPLFSSDFEKLAHFAHNPKIDTIIEDFGRLEA